MNKLRIIKMKKFYSVILMFILLASLSHSAFAEVSPPELNVQIDGTYLTLSWSEVAEASGYRLYYAAYPYESGDPIYSAEMFTNNSFSINLPVVATYYAAIKAYDANSESDYSNIELITNNLDAPVLTVETSGLFVNLTWPEIQGATGYHLYFAPYPTTDPDPFNHLDLGNKTSEAYYLWENAAYTVFIRAYDAAGSEGETSNVETFILGPQNPDLLLTPLGRGTNIFGVYAEEANVLSPVLDVAALDMDGYVEKKTLDNWNYVNKSGKNFSEYRNAWALNIGVGGSYSYFEGSAKASFSFEGKSTSEYSFATIMDMTTTQSLSLQNNKRSLSHLSGYLTPEFINDIEMLKLDRSDEEVNGQIEDLIKAYGTHVMAGVYMGGRLDYNYSATINEDEVENKDGWSAHVEGTFNKKFGIEGDVSQATDTYSSSQISNTKTEINTKGGANFTFTPEGKSAYDAWRSSISADNQAFIGIEKGAYIGIWELVADQDKKNRIKEYYDEYALSFEPSKVRVVLEKLVCTESNDEGNDNAVEISEARFWLYAYYGDNIDDNTSYNQNQNFSQELIYHARGYANSNEEFSMDTYYLSEHEVNKDQVLDFDNNRYDFDTSLIKIEGYIRERDFFFKTTYDVAEAVKPIYGREMLLNTCDDQLSKYTNDFPSGTGVHCMKISHEEQWTIWAIISITPLESD